MASLEETNCCGIRELDGVMIAKDARSAVIDAAENWFEDDNDGAFIFFSVTNTNTRGQEVADYIKKYKLGTVYKTHKMRNPNSGNMLAMWVWQVNKSNFKSFWHATTRYKEQYKNDY